MTTGPEHYQKAEQLINAATREDGSANDTTVARANIALAQVHATLAQAVAPTGTTSVADQAIWESVEKALGRVDRMSFFHREPDQVKDLVCAVRTLLATRNSNITTA